MHVDPPPIPLIRSKKNDRSDKYFYEIKLGRDLTSEKLDLYEFKMVLFDNGETEEFLLLVYNFNMTPEASIMLETAGKMQYLRMLAHG